MISIQMYAKVHQKLTKCYTAKILEGAKRRVVEAYEADVDYLHLADALSVSRRNTWNLARL